MANKKDDITKDKDVKKILEEIDSQINDKKKEMLEEFKKEMDKQIEMNVQKRVEVEAKKLIRGKTGKIIRRDIVILLLIAIIGYLGYCLYDIGYFNKNLPVHTEVVETPKKEETVKDTAYYVKNYGELVENLQVPNILQEISNGISKDNMPNALKLKIAYKNLEDSKKTTDGEVLTFDSNSLLEAYKNICGDNTSLEYSVFEYENLKFLYFNDTFITESSSLIPTAKANYKITNAYETGNKLTFELTYDGQLGTYKYIFDRNGNNYYFNKIEKM